MALKYINELEKELILKKYNFIKSIENFEEFEGVFLEFNELEIPFFKKYKDIYIFYKNLYVYLKYIITNKEKIESLNLKNIKVDIFSNFPSVYIINNNETIHHLKNIKFHDINTFYEYIDNERIRNKTS